MNNGLISFFENSFLNEENAKSVEVKLSFPTFTTNTRKMLISMSIYVHFVCYKKVILDIYSFNFKRKEMNMKLTNL